MVGTMQTTKTTSVVVDKNITKKVVAMNIAPPSNKGLERKDWLVDGDAVKVFVNGTRIKSPGVNYTLSDINQNDNVVLSGQPATEVYVTR